MVIFFGGDAFGTAHLSLLSREVPYTVQPGNDPWDQLLAELEDAARTDDAAQAANVRLLVRQVRDASWQLAYSILVVP